MKVPATLDHAGIAARLPHAGSMCLLDSLLEADADRVRCRVTGHADPAHPLRRPGGLPAAAGLEIAAQAMALHAALHGAPDGPPQPGFLAAARGVRLHVARLDDIGGALVVEAARVAGDTRQAIYRFALADESGRALVDGRATVVLGTAPAAPGAVDGA